MTHHLSHCQPFSVDEMFHASLSTDWKIRVTLCPPVLREMIVALRASIASEYGMNVPVKHTTLRCYGPGHALILLLIMPFGVVDSQRTYHRDSTP